MPLGMANSRPANDYLGICLLPSDLLSYVLLPSQAGSQAQVIAKMVTSSSALTSYQLSNPSRERQPLYQ